MGCRWVDSIGRWGRDEVGGLYMRKVRVYERLFGVVLDIVRWVESFWTSCISGRVRVIDVLEVCLVSILLSGLLSKRKWITMISAST